MTLNWFEPDEDGGSPITGYWVEKFDPESDKWIRCNKLPIKDTTFRWRIYRHNDKKSSANRLTHIDL